MDIFISWDALSPFLWNLKSVQIISFVSAGEFFWSLSFSLHQGNLDFLPVSIKVLVQAWTFIFSSSHEVGSVISFQYQTKAALLAHLSPSTHRNLDPFLKCSPKKFWFLPTHHDARTTKRIHHCQTQHVGTSRSPHGTKVSSLLKGRDARKGRGKGIGHPDPKEFFNSRTHLLKRMSRCKSHGLRTKSAPHSERTCPLQVKQSLLNIMRSLLEIKLSSFMC